MENVQPNFLSAIFVGGYLVFSSTLLTQHCKSWFGSIVLTALAFEGIFAAKPPEFSFIPSLCRTRSRIFFLLSADHSSWRCRIESNETWPLSALSSPKSSIEKRESSTFQLHLCSSSFKQLWVIQWMFNNLILIVCRQYQAQIRGLNAHDRHKKFLKDYGKFAKIDV